MPCTTPNGVHDGVGGERGGRVDKRIGYGFNQSCGNRRSVGWAFVFGLLWCGRVSGVGGLSRVWRGGMVLCLSELKDSLSRWRVQVSVYCAWWIPAHLRCTKCSIL